MTVVRGTPAVTITHEPGNGTCYRLVCTTDHQGGGGWMWLEGARVYAAGWWGGDDLRVSLGKITREDRRAILEALLTIDEAQALLAPVYRVNA